MISYTAKHLDTIFLRVRPHRISISNVGLNDRKKKGAIKVNSWFNVNHTRREKHGKSRVTRVGPAALSRRTPVSPFYLRFNATGS